MADIDQFRSIARQGLVILVSAVVMLVPALVNGYPLVYSDTGTYLRSALESYVPVDRPYWYGLFVRYTSLNGITLWGVVVAQALLVATYVWRLSSKMLPAARVGRTTLLASACMTLCTSSGWYVGQVIPDVFTSIGLMAVFLLLCSDDTSPWARGWDMVVISLSAWMHLSNLLILPLAGAVLLCITRNNSTSFGRAPVARLAGTVVLAWCGLACANRVLDGEAYISRSGPAFLMGRMIDMGMLAPYLEEHCATERFAICAFKDSLPGNGQEFLWWDNSPMVRQGGWEKTEMEYARIVRGSLMEQRYLWWHVRGSLSATAELLRSWEIAEGLRSSWYRTPDSPPYAMLARHLPHEMDAYLGSLQNGGRGELDMRWPDMLYRITLGSALVIGLYIVLRSRRSERGRDGAQLVIFAIAGIAIGAWVCATLSTPIPRYLARDSWLLPLAVILALDARSPIRTSLTGAPKAH